MTVNTILLQSGNKVSNRYYRDYIIVETCYKNIFIVWYKGKENNPLKWVCAAIIVLKALKMKGDTIVLHDFMHIMAYIARNPGERECLSCYLYRKQHENVDFQTNYKRNDDNIDKYGKEIADKLEKSIQKAIDKKK